MPSQEQTPSETTDLLAELREQSPSQQQSELDAIIPRPSCAYQCFMLISSVGVLLSAVMFTGQIASLALFKHFFMDQLLRIYLMSFSIMFILAELRVEWFLNLATSMNNWVYRGFLYSFNGVIGVEMSKAWLAEIYPENPGPLQHGTSLLVSVTSYIMFVLGFLYMCMGVCCLHGVWERIKSGYDTEMEKAIDQNRIRVR